MAPVILCPSCGRRLSVNQTLPPDSLVACPGCGSEFCLAAASAGAEGTPPATGAAPTEAVSERLLTRSERLSRPSHYDEEPARADQGDEDDELPALGRRRPERRWLGWRGAAALVLLVLVAVVAWVIYTSPRVEVAGSWRGKFEFVQFDVPCTYEFRPDGTFVDEHVDPATGILGRFPGQYRVSGTYVTIQWLNGGFERAHVRATGLDSIEYTIVAHSDLDQVGAKVTFTRVKR